MKAAVFVRRDDAPVGRGRGLVAEKGKDGVTFHVDRFVDGVTGIDHPVEVTLSPESVRELADWLVGQGRS
jgi:hypothetical protein